MNPNEYQQLVAQSEPLLDETNVAEEVGDLLQYVVVACNALGLSLEEVMESNIRKLRKRYPDKYTDEHALEENRDRDAERTVLEDESGTEIGSTGTPGCYCPMCEAGRRKTQRSVEHEDGDEQ